MLHLQPPSAWCCPVGSKGSTTPFCCVCILVQIYVCACRCQCWTTDGFAPFLSDMYSVVRVCRSVSVVHSHVCWASLSSSARPACVVLGTRGDRVGSKRMQPHACKAAKQQLPQRQRLLGLMPSAQLGRVCLSVGRECLGACDPAVAMAAASAAVVSSGACRDVCCVDGQGSWEGDGHTELNARHVCMQPRASSAGVACVQGCARSSFDLVLRFMLTGLLRSGLRQHATTCDSMHAYPAVKPCCGTHMLGQQSAPLCCCAHMPPVTAGQLLWTCCMGRNQEDSLNAFRSGQHMCVGLCLAWCSC